eukprot:6272082-Alexandrium_andersonii.AAC.1
MVHRIAPVGCAGAPPALGARDLVLRTALGIGASPVRPLHRRSVLLRLAVPLRLPPAGTGLVFAAAAQ